MLGSNKASKTFRNLLVFLILLIWCAVTTYLHEYTHALIAEYFGINTTTHYYIFWGYTKPERLPADVCTRSLLQFAQSMVEVVQFLISSLLLLLVVVILYKTFLETDGGR